MMGLKILLNGQYVSITASVVRFLKNYFSTRKNDRVWFL